jgi:hypothetical protein
MVCFVVEQAVDEIAGMGVYILLNQSGAPYVGRSENINRRLGEHAADAAKEILDPLKNWVARFKFLGDGIDMRQAEQFVLDLVKTEVGIGPKGKVAGNSNILNKRNEIKKFVGKLDICK